MEVEEESEFVVKLESEGKQRDRGPYKLSSVNKSISMTSYDVAGLTAASLATLEVSKIPATP